MQKPLQVMLQLQDAMNNKVHENWREQQFAWFRAAWIECAELIDHHGYKWWKKQACDLPQVQLEIVDIWHFGLSMLIDGREFSAIAEEIVQQLNKAPIETRSIIDATEALAADLLTRRQFDVRLFFALLTASSMSFEDLFKQYVGKNVLNLFRQDHGYKQGTYIKLWHGREDNEVLSEIMQQQAVDEHYAETVYRALEVAYNNL